MDSWVISHSPLRLTLPEFTCIYFSIWSKLTNFFASVELSDESYNQMTYIYIYITWNGNELKDTKAEILPISPVAGAQEIILWVIMTKEKLLFMLKCFKIIATSLSSAYCKNDRLCPLSCNLPPLDLDTGEAPVSFCRFKSKPKWETQFSDVITLKVLKWAEQQSVCG